MTQQTPGPGHDGQPQLTDETLAAIRDAWACGVPLGHLAAWHGCTEQALRRMMQLPPSRAIPEPPAEQRAPIGPQHIMQMRRRSQQQAALAQWDARRAAPGGQQDG